MMGGLVGDGTHESLLAELNGSRKTLEPLEAGTRDDKLVAE
jgi:hypothetical protein